eukprot:758170-Hanusia_phi.AAC.2
MCFYFNSVSGPKGQKFTPARQEFTVISSQSSGTNLGSLVGGGVKHKVRFTPPLDYKKWGDGVPVHRAYHWEWNVLP